MNRQESEKLISAYAADLLISLRDGDMALLYLYLCRTGVTDREKAREALFLPRQRLNEAWERLEISGLLPLSAADLTSVRQQSPSPSAVTAPESVDLPEYSAEDVRIRCGEDSGFSAVLKEAQGIVGRALSTPDLIKLLGIYDHLDLPAEVMMMLMHYVADVYREKYGESRRPTARAFEREAQDWAERGITDFDGAEAYIRTARERKSLMGQIREAMNIQGRDLTDTERRYITQWLDFGFGPEEIRLAYDRTVTQTGKFSMAYMKTILQNWHMKNLHSMKEILEKDRPRSHGSSSTSPGPQSIDTGKLNEIEVMMKGIRK